jgi:deoxyribonuclease-4
LILGAHMSIAGGVHRALERGRSIACDAVQIFTRNQLRWFSPPIDREQVEAFRRRGGEFRQLLAHASYLINLASPEDTTYSRSVAALEEEMRRCRLLGIPLLVLHPGFHLGRGAKPAVERLVRGARSAIGQEDGAVKLVLETTAGAGSSLGGRFEHVRELLHALEEEGVPCGVCFDTCHVFAAGYELRHRDGYERTWETFDAVIGRKHLAAIHLNDCGGGLGSRKDRHEHIGRGAIGLAGFTLLARDPRLENVPAVLETPKGRDMREDIDNLRLLRSLGAGS